MKRRTLIGAFGALTTGLGVSISQKRDLAFNLITDPRIKVVKQLYESKSHYTELSSAAPVGTTKAAVFTTEEDAVNRVQWTGLTQSEETGSLLEVDFSEEFISLVVAALEPNQRLRQLRDPTVEDGVIQYQYTIDSDDTQYGPSSTEKYFLHHVHIWQDGGASPETVAVNVRNQ